MIDRWITNGRPEGTQYSIELTNEETVQEFMKSVGNLDGALRGDRSVTLQMMNGLQLTVSYRASKFYGEEATHWVVELKVHGDAMDEL